jgi:hypothetical protein
MNQIFFESIIVKNCYSCPFAEIDEDGDICNAPGNVNLKLFADERLPENEVHKSCPLKLNSILVSLQKN